MSFLGTTKIVDRKIGKGQKQRIHRERNGSQATLTEKYKFKVTHMQKLTTVQGLKCKSKNSKTTDLPQLMMGIHSNKPTEECKYC